MPLKVTWALLFIVGMPLSFVTKKDLVNGIAIELIFFDALGFAMVGFAHQCAKIYTAIMMSPTK